MPRSEAQEFTIDQLPKVGAVVDPSSAFVPLSLKGLIIDPKKPLEFQFIIDTGHSPRDSISLKSGLDRLVKYFLVGLTIP